MTGVLRVALPLLTGSLGLMRQSPWTDELFTLHLARLGWAEGIWRGLSTNSLPLHPMLAWAATLGGESLLGGRLLSLAAFVLATLLVARVAGRLGGPRAGRAAWLLCALSPVLVWHAQDARAYTLVVLAVAGLLDAWLDLREGQSRTACWRPGAWALAGLLLHVYFAPAVLAVGLALLAERPAAWRRALAGLVLAGLLALPCWYLLVTGSEGLPAGYQKPVGPESLGYASLTIGAGYAVGPTPIALHGPEPMAALRRAWPPVVAALAAFWIPALILLIVAWRTRRAERVALGAGLLLAILIPFCAASAVPGVTFNPRYVLPGLPFLIIGMALGLARLPRRVAGALLALLLLVGVTGLVRQHQLPEYGKEDYAGVARWIERNVPADEPVFAAPSPTLLGCLLPGRELGLLTREALAGHTGNRSWFVLNRAWDADPDGSLRRGLPPEPTARLHGFEVYAR